MSIIQGNAHTSTGGGGFNVERSLRFNPADSAYLNRTLGTSNRRTFTLSTWVKRSLLASNQCILGNINFAGGGSTNQQFFLGFNGSDQLDLLHYNNGTSNGLTSSAVYRDPSAWYHVVCAIDTTQATSSNRLKLYINGSQITAFASSSYPTQNTDTFINANLATAIGVQVGTGIGNSYFLGGYLTEVNFIDGQALTPSSFGETDSATGVWKPKAYSGTYGTNGFYLNFSDNSGTTSTTLGKDSSGNGNNWTPNNFSVTAGAGNDSLVDSPTAYGTDTGAGGSVRGNYATWNPLENGSATFVQGNLRTTTSTTSGKRSVGSTVLVSSGSWYCEVECVTNGSSSAAIGIANTSFVIGSEIGANCYAYYNDGMKIINGSYSAYGASYTNGDIIGIAFNADSGTLTFYKNGSSQGAISSIPAGTYRIAVAGNSSVTASTFEANFGQRAFAYTAPSGFKALCTTNLPTPTIGATSTTQAGNYFNPVLYTGTGVARSVTGVGFQPDFVWIKARSAAENHQLQDAVRGATRRLFSNLTDAESISATSLTSFDSNGFSVGIDGNYNGNGTTFVSWNWNAGGSNATNTSGTITSTVRANTTAGFSIVTFTTDGTTKTVGHGLGAKPSLVIIKRRNGADAWLVITDILGSMQYGVLNTTAAFTSIGYSAPTSTVFSYNDNNGNTQVAYCFAPVAGYSAFGSYTGNGSTDGPFVYTGFRPRFVIVKRTSGIEKWYMMDTARDTDNPIDITQLVANASDAEGTFTAFDFTSNGFKNRTSNVMSNGNGDTYIYMAFAENPFKYSLAR
jgi:hypothetical protein